MSSILQWGSSPSLISKKDFEESLIKFLYTSKFLANKGILPLLPLCWMLIWVPIIGWVLDFAIDSENSKAPHKLFESHKPTALILFTLQYLAKSKVLKAPSQMEYCVWIFRWVNSFLVTSLIFLYYITI